MRGDLRLSMKTMPGNMLDELDSIRRDMDSLQRALVTPDAVVPLAGVVERAFTKEKIADNTATTLFSILTTNEDGNNDGGVYSCQVHAVVAHAGTPTASNSAVKSFVAHFGRVQKNSGAGETTTVSEISETASAATTAATRDVGTVTLTTVEDGEYQLDVQITVDLTGSSPATANVVIYARLVHFGFVTAPEMVQLA